MVSALQSITIRPERGEDAFAIRKMVTAAFANASHSSGTESQIIDALRASGMLALSLVAQAAGEIVGHVAFSPVTHDGTDLSWVGLGPAAVHPDYQRRGVGARLIEAGLSRLREAGANGCVVLGDPAYYCRFGFANDRALSYPGVPAEYFQCLPFDGPLPAGTVAYHGSFEAS
ncbi:MAG TPA: N-acetyltransferase [Novosphingobium sp.]|nr:N-acetyltransferase [Novosphingobium sp.]